MPTEKRKVKQPRRNWMELRKEWLTGKYATLIEFSKKKHVNYRSLCQYSAKHKWRKRALEVVEKCVEQAVIREADLVAKARVKHLKLAGLLLDKGSVTLARKKSLGVGHSLVAVKMGVDIERRTLEMDKHEGGTQNNTLNQILTIVGGDAGNGGNGGNGKAERIGRAIVAALRNGGAAAGGPDSARVQADMAGTSLPDQDVPDQP